MCWRRRRSSRAWWPTGAGRFAAPIVRRLFATVFPYLASELRLEGTGDADHWLAELEAAGVIETRGDGFLPPADATDRFRLRLLANTVMPILERFYIAAILLLNTGAGVVDRRALLAGCRANAQRISKLHGIGAPEFSDARLFEGFLQGLLNNGVVTTNADGKFEFDERIGEIARAGRSVIAVELRQALEDRLVTAIPTDAPEYAKAEAPASAAVPASTAASAAAPEQSPPAT